MASPATGAWLDQDGAIATWADNVWLFAPPQPGAVVRDVASSSIAVFDASDGWRRAASPPPPVNGAIQDLEAREAIAAIVAGLHRLGIFSV